jgi:hypothetical protein
MSVIIHVAQDAIRRNAKHGTCDPAIIVRNRRGSKRYSQLEIRTPDGQLVGTFKYQPHDPLPCGARLWLKLEEGFNAEPIS